MKHHSYSLPRYNRDGVCPAALAGVRSEEENRRVQWPKTPTTFERNVRFPITRAHHPPSRMGCGRMLNSQIPIQTP